MFFTLLLKGTSWDFKEFGTLIIVSVTQKEPHNEFAHVDLVDHPLHLVKHKKGAKSVNHDKLFFTTLGWMWKLF